MAVTPGDGEDLLPKSSSPGVWVKKAKRECAFLLQKSNSTQVSGEASILRPRLLYSRQGQFALLCTERSVNQKYEDDSSQGANHDSVLGHACSTGCTDPRGVQHRAADTDPIPKVLLPHLAVFQHVRLFQG